MKIIEKMKTFWNEGHKLKNTKRCNGNLRGTSEFLKEKCQANLVWANLKTMHPKMAEDLMAEDLRKYFE